MYAVNTWIHRSVVLILLVSNNIKWTEAGLADSWITFVKESRSILNTCSINVSRPMFIIKLLCIKQIFWTSTYQKDPQILPSWSCLKTGSLEMFEKITASDVIPLTNAIRLIRHHAPNESNRSSQWLVQIHYQIVWQRREEWMGRRKGGGGWGYEEEEEWINHPDVGAIEVKFIHKHFPFMFIETIRQGAGANANKLHWQTIWCR